VHLNRSDCERC